MADASVDSSQEQKEDADKKKKNILEEKSKEDLIKLVKKYLNLLQKSKTKTDELNEKCLILEQEKTHASQVHQSSVKELQDKIENLQHDISKLESEKITYAEKDQEIGELKQKLKEAVDEKNSHAPSLRENEEQLQCLNLQLQSLKASCQCIQEENIKLQKSNKEKTEEINSLNKIHQSLSSDFNKKLGEYVSLLNLKDSIEEKYEKSVEKIHSLQKLNEKLDIENENLQKNNNELSDEVQKFEKMDVGIIFKDFQKCQEEKEKLQKQVQEFKKRNNQKSPTIIESETDNSSAASEIRDNKFYATLEQEKLSLEEKNRSLQSELDSCHIKIHELEREIKNVVNSCQLNDYRMGIELALLQGATTEGLICPVESVNSKVEISHSKASNVSKNDDETVKKENYYPFENTSGLEFALLQGGDASNLVSEESSSNIYSTHIPYDGIGNSASRQKEVDLMSNYKATLEKLKAEKESLHKKLVEYSSLCEDTMNENDSLKQELEDMKAKFFRIVNNQKEAVKECDSSDDKKTVKKSISSEDHVKSCANCNQLCIEIVGFYKYILSENVVNADPEALQGDHLEILRKIQNLYARDIRDLQNNKYKLNECNLQLELLVIGVKQGVRQKNPASSYQTENNLEENMSALKLIVDDLVSRTSCFDSKLKMVQSQARNEMQEMTDQLNQLKELNQFLEDENRELNSEVEKLKYSLSDVEKCNNEYLEDSDQHNAELYSIDERSEFDDRGDANSNIKLHNETPKVHDISVQVFSMVQDAAIQIEQDFCSKQKTENAVIQTDITTESYEKLIDQLTNENESLKKVVNEKTNLVESIHCQMDSLLTKIEELTVELQNKEDDLKHFQCLNADCQRMLIETQNIKKQQINDLKIARSLILNFKTANSDLSKDVESFIITYKNLITSVNNDISNIIVQNCLNIDHFKDMCNHKENNFNIIKEWICKFTKEFEDWFSFMDQVTPDSIPDMSQLERYTEDSSEKFLFDKICDTDACCSILESIDNLNSYKRKLFSAFFNHLSNNYSLLVNDLHSYKESILPRMEKNISELEVKIAECTCKNNSKEQTVTEVVQEKASEESLKNSLADAEMKMNKFKQIAVKLKKELALTKEQYNEIVSEKEKLQKQNAKLQDDLNKTSEDQCKYVQNYQSLQNELDKLQDDCEMHKLNQKKLEEDLATKLDELTTLKEKVSDLESQLKSSKHLLELNASNKKELDIKCADLESKIIILDSKIHEKEQKNHSLEMDIEKHLKDLNTAWEENKKLKDSLELAQKEGNKKSLLDLEMADYERSITELNNQIKKKEDEMEELQNEIQSLKERYDCLQEELQSTEALKETEAKRAESLKEILEKTKSELSEVKDHETELLSKKASLEIQLEAMTQQEEDFKLQLSETSAQVQHLQDVLKTSSDNHQRIVRSYEQKISNQKEEILIAHKEMESVKEEFENYKVRVHSVLKQQKSATSVIATVDADLKEKLEAVNEKLTLQVKGLSEELTAVSLEYDTLQEEYRSLLQRYDKVNEDREQKEKEWHQRLELLNAEKNRLRATQEELSSQHLLQNEMLVATYKKQIKIMSEEHKRIVSDLQKQLDAADVEISRLQRDQQKLQGLPVTPSPQDSTTSFDLLSQERQEGEGSESTDETNTPIRHLSLATIPTSGFLTLEKLIQSPVEPGTPASYVSTYDSEKLAADLNTANKKVDHLSELLNDSESTNLRLSEQVRVLKDEVRRLENNKEREQHAENLEYLKNVFIKFATLQPGSEKAMLIPVLTTMLKLSSNEQQQLKSIAGDVQSDDNINAGWGSYLHRWSGLS